MYIYTKRYPENGTFKQETSLKSCKNAKDKYTLYLLFKLLTYSVFKLENINVTKSMFSILNTI